MARFIEAGETKVSREDVFFIDPNEIVVNFPANARWKPLNRAKVVEYARSFKADGQLQPCLARPMHDKRVQLSAGFHRYSASLLVRYGSPEDGIEADPGFKLMVRVVPMSEKEAFRAGVIENKKRNETSVIDDAHNYRRMKMFGYTDEEVAELFECKLPWLKTIEALLVLSEDIQLMVHERRLTVSDAWDLTRLSEDKRKEILAGALPQPQQQSLPNVAEAAPAPIVDKKAKKVVRERIKSALVASGKNVAPSTSEVRNFLKSIAFDDEMPEAAQDTCKYFLEFLSGKRDTAGMKRVLKLLADVPEVIEDVVEVEV